MAKRKKNDLNVLDEKKLNEQLENLRKELIKLNAQAAAGTLPENPGKISKIKRDIARILTFNNQKLKKDLIKKTKEEIK